MSTIDRRRLSERTGGWPAPLRLAAVLMSARDREAFIESFTGGSRHVVDYLTREVLDLLEPSTREFLLQVSVLGRLNGALCDAVAGTTGSGKLLADLERANLFLSVESAGEWYEQHQLFAEALRLELQRTDAELVPVLHGRASQWFESVGDLETATEHAIAGRDVVAASRLVAGQVQTMASTGRWAIIRRWLSQLSWPEAQRDPELAYARATAAALSNRIDEAIDWLAVVRTGAPDQRDAAGLPLAFRADFTEAMVGVNDVSRAEAAAAAGAGDIPHGRMGGHRARRARPGALPAGAGQRSRGAFAPSGGQIPDDRPIMLAFAVANLGLAEASSGVGSHASPMLDRLSVLLDAIGVDRSPGGALVHLACGERDRRRVTCVAPSIDSSWRSRSSNCIPEWMAGQQLHLARRDPAAARRHRRCGHLARPG